MDRTTPVAPARPRIVARFAVGSLVVLILIGAGVSILAARNIRAGKEEAATFHAVYVADNVLGPFLRDRDLTRPLDATEHAEVLGFVRLHVLSDRQVVLVRVWAPDGTILYSDDEGEVGQSFPEKSEDLAAVMRGEIESEVSAVIEPGEPDGGPPSRARVYEAYVPLSTRPGDPPLAVAEFYQDYEHIEAAVDDQFGELTVIFGIGLVLLFLALMPIATKASGALRRQNAELERQAARLSVLLAREQETVAELQELNRMKSDFVATASHELRSPLTAILGFARLLRRPEFDQDPASRHEFLESMERQGDRLFRLIENLLTTARLEGEGVPLETQRFDLAALVGDVAEGLHASERIRVDIPEEGIEMETDRDRLAEVVSNLVENALKYSPPASPVDVGGRLSGARIRLWVRDRGVGIPPESLDRIFDRFWQADGSATRTVGGVGLGLYLVRRLVGLLGGEIEVESEVGRGTCFTVDIPRRHRAASPSAPADTKGPEARPESAGRAVRAGAV
ncbi:MAG: HAMP domain-containing histidine kinase [Actinobacteria bacterium]|nr:HAMP domain-containing histidine kinase [Actinomycetota bacterium]